MRQIDELPVSYKKEIKTMKEVSIWFSDQTSYWILKIELIFILSFKFTPVFNSDF